MRSLTPPILTPPAPSPPGSFEPWMRYSVEPRQGARAPGWVVDASGHVARQVRPAPPHVCRRGPRRPFGPALHARRAPYCRLDPLTPSTWIGGDRGISHATLVGARPDCRLGLDHRHRYGFIARPEHLVAPKPVEPAPSAIDRCRAASGPSGSAAGRCAERSSSLSVSRSFSAAFRDPLQTYRAVPAFVSVAFDRQGCA